MTRTLRIALPVALLLAATTARAQEEAAAAPEPQPRASYRMQLVAADVGSVGLIVAGGFADGASNARESASEFLVFSGLAGFAIGAPAVHLAHGEAARAGISLAARLLLPIVGANLGFATASCTQDEWLCGVGQAAAGFVIGAATASVLDATLIAPSYAAEPERPRPRAQRSAPSVTPRLVATQNVAMLGVGGSF